MEFANQKYLAKLGVMKMNNETTSTEPLVSVCIPTHNRALLHMDRSCAAGVEADSLAAGSAV